MLMLPHPDPNLLNRRSLQNVLNDTYSHGMNEEFLEINDLTDRKQPANEDVVCLDGEVMSRTVLQKLTQLQIELKEEREKVMKLRQQLLQKQRQESKQLTARILSQYEQLTKDHYLLQTTLKENTQTIERQKQRIEALVTGLQSCQSRSDDMVSALEAKLDEKTEELEELIVRFESKGHDHQSRNVLAQQEKLEEQKRNDDMRRNLEEMRKTLDTKEKELELRSSDLQNRLRDVLNQEDALRRKASQIPIRHTKGLKIDQLIEIHIGGKDSQVTVDSLQKEIVTSRAIQNVLRQQLETMQKIRDTTKQHESLSFSKTVAQKITLPFARMNVTVKREVEEPPLQRKKKTPELIIESPLKRRKGKDSRVEASPNAKSSVASKQTRKEITHDEVKSGRAIVTRSASRQNTDNH